VGTAVEMMKTLLGGVPADAETVGARERLLEILDVKKK
jgi:hypothetical protein